MSLVGLVWDTWPTQPDVQAGDLDASRLEISGKGFGHQGCGVRGPRVRHEAPEGRAS